MEILGVAAVVWVLFLIVLARRIPDERYGNTDDNLGPF